MRHLCFGNIYIFATFAFWQHLHSAKIGVLTTFVFCNICVLAPFVIWNICVLVHLPYGNICIWTKFWFQQHLLFGNIFFWWHWHFDNSFVFASFAFWQHLRHTVDNDSNVYTVHNVHHVHNSRNDHNVHNDNPLSSSLISPSTILFQLKTCLSLSLQFASMNELTYRVIPRPWPWLCLTDKGHGRKNYSNVHFSISEFQLSSISVFLHFSAVHGSVSSC